MDKKRIQATTALEYLEGLLTGTNVVNTFNAECRQGKWSGKLRDLGLPWTRDEGRELAQLNANDPINRKYSSSRRRLLEKLNEPLLDATPTQLF